MPLKGTRNGGLRQTPCSTWHGAPVRQVGVQGASPHYSDYFPALLPLTLVSAGCISTRCSRGPEAGCDQVPVRPRDCPHGGGCVQSICVCARRKSGTNVQGGVRGFPNQDSLRKQQNLMWILSPRLTESWN